jgi:hypothetical protein
MTLRGAKTLLLSTCKRTLQVNKSMSLRRDLDREAKKKTGEEKLDTKRKRFSGRDHDFRKR